jgi:hypothetical protein
MPLLDGDGDDRRPNRRPRNRGLVKRTIARLRPPLSLRESVFVANSVGVFWLFSDLGDKVPSWESDSAGLDLLLATVTVFGRPLVLVIGVLIVYLPTKVLALRGVRYLRSR